MQQLEVRVLLSATTQQTSQRDVTSVDQATYLVIFEGQSNQSDSVIANQHQEFVRTLSEIFREPIRVQFDYTSALDAVAVKLTAEQAQTVSTLPTVASVLADAASHVQSNSAEGTGAVAVWNGSAMSGVAGTFGEGVLVGIIDSGIDFDSASFAEVGPVDGYVHVNPLGTGNFVGVCNPGSSDFDATLPCNNKLIGAWNFTSDPINEPGDADHGTSVAAIAAGNFVTADVPNSTATTEISGVAPHASIISYDVCTTINDCSNSAIVAAVDQAIADGVDVINLSIGGGSDDPWNAVMATALLNAFEAGIFVAASAGNEGPGPDSITSPADAPWVTGVAAIGNSDIAVTSISVFGDSVLQSLAVLSAIAGENISIPQNAGPYSVVHAADVSPGDPLGSSAYPANTFAGSIALIDRGESLFETKVLNAYNAGAVAVVVINNVAGPSIIMAGVDGVPIPSVLISREDGTALRRWLRDHPEATVRLNAEQTQNLTVVADFSSRGSNIQADTLAPNIAAPGADNLVIAPAATDGTDTWRYFSGTSAASPHIAGAAALLVAIHPDWSPAEIQSALQTTAISSAEIAKDRSLSSADAFDVGSGLVNVSRAANAGIVLYESAADFRTADPSNGGVPSRLNLASFVDSNINGSTTSWTRSITSTQASVVTWTPSFLTDDGLTLTLNQNAITLAPAATADLILTGNITTVTTGEWLFGELILTADADLPVARFPVAVRPPKSAGVTIQPSGSGTDVSEAGAVDTYEISLNTYASGNVALRVDALSGVEVSSDGTTFSSFVTLVLRDDQQSQTVTVRAVDDALAQGHRTAVLTHSIITPVVDQQYPVSTVIADVVVSVFDNDQTPGLTVSRSQANTIVSESGTTHTFDVALRVRPVSNVVVSVTSSDTSEAVADRSMLAFTPATWNVPQTVTVTGQDDIEQDGDTHNTVTLAILADQSDATFADVPDSVIAVTVLDDEVPAPESVSPIGVTNQQRPVFEWTSVTGAVSYEIFLRRIGAQQDPILNPTITGTTLILDEDLGIGRYQYWVRARYSATETSPWVGTSFQISVAPVIVMLTQGTSQNAPEISWNSVAGAENYEVYIYNTTTQQVFNDRSLTASRYTPAAALTFGRYRIWVRAFGAGNYAGVWSAAEEYIIGPQPVSPVSPTFNVRPAFTWTAPLGAASYEIYIRNPDGSVTTVSDLKSPAYEPPGDLVAGRYFWWVRGFTEGGRTAAWSERAETNIGGRTTVVAPTETTNDASPLITWRAVVGAESYEIFLDRTDTPTHIITTRNISGTSFETGVLEDGRYAVWVRARNANGMLGPWSPRSTFVVTAVTSSITVTPVVSQLITFGTTPTLLWSAHPDAVAYDVQLFDGFTTITETITGSTSWTTPDLGQGQWQWWVRAIDVDGNAGPFSAAATIDTTARTVLLSPLGAVSGTPAFVWANVELADRYILQVEKRTTGTAPVIREDHLTSNEFTPNTPLPAGEYRFWVRAIRNSDPGVSFWSFATDFTVT